MDQGRRSTDRKAVGLLVKLKHSDVGRFVEEFATNLSPGGMFIRSRQPQPVGTLVRFEVQIAAGVRVLRGNAVVRWIRQPDDPAGPAGMGLQFTQLDPASKALIDVMLQQNKAQAGGASSAGASPTSAATSARPAGAPGGSAAPRGAGQPHPVAHGEPTPLPSPQDVDIPLSELVARTPPPVHDSLLADLMAMPAPPPELSKLGRVLPPPLAPGSAFVGVPVSSAEEEPSDEVTVPIPLPDGELPEEFLDLQSLVQSMAREEREFELDLSEFDAPAAPAQAPAAPPVAPAAAPVMPAAGPLAPAVAPLAPAVAPVAPAVAPVAPAVAPVAPAVAPLAPAVAPVVPAVAPRVPAVLPAMSPPAATTSVAPPPAGAPAAPRAVAVQPLATSGAAAAVAPVSSPVSAAAAPAHAQEGRIRTVFLKPPEQLEGTEPSTGPIIGIDLGTTNSCVAVLANGRPMVLRSREGYNTIPSVVSLSAQGKLLVSHRARSQLVLRPQQSIYGAKRLVGRPFESAVVRQVRERFHYDIISDEHGRAAVRLAEHVLSLEEVQGLILRECKEMAEAFLNQKVERAVVTVPAYYAEQQREAVRKAGWMAGLKVERILNEPTSAALAFGLNRELSKRVLVYDLGGGTFDATLMKVEKNVFEVLATGGDVFLGGLDFDNVVVDLLLDRFEQQEKVAFSGDNVALSRVSDAAERAKVALSERSSYEVHIPMLMMDVGGKGRDLRVTLTRTEVEQACMPLVRRTLDVVRDVLLDAELKPSDVDDIILVGGQSRMPLVRERLKELFGKPPHASVNADEAVALGAALYAGAVDKVSSVVLIDVLPMTIGIAMPGGAFKRVIERNTPLPVQRSFAITTTRDNEQALELSLFQGEDTHVSANEYLGTVRIEGLPPGPRGSVRVALTLKLDSECVLHVTASEHSTRKEVRATLATRYTPEELQRKLGVTQEAAKAAEARRGEEIKQRSGRFWGMLKRMVGRQ